MSMFELGEALSYWTFPVINLNPARLAAPARPREVVTNGIFFKSF